VLVSQDRSVVEAGKDLDSTLIDFEENLFQIRLTGGGQDVFRNPSKLYARLGFLYSEVETSWGGVGSDWPPTSQATEVHQLLKERLRSYQGRLRELVAEDVAAFNRLLGEHGLGGLVVIEP